MFGMNFGNQTFRQHLHTLFFNHLWATLKVGEHLQNWTRHPWCPICVQIETVEHSLNHCRFHQLTRDVIQFCLGPHYQGDTSEFLSVKSSHSAPQGVVLWVGRAAHWAVRTAAKFHRVPPHRETFLDMWARLVFSRVEWQPLQGWARVFQQVYQSICTMRQTGCLPHAQNVLQKHSDC